MRELIATRIETPTHLAVLMALCRAPRPALTVAELAAATLCELRPAARAALDLERGRILAREGERYRYDPGDPALAAVFFLRFWRRTADRLFLLFSLALALLALQRALLLLLGDMGPGTAWLAALRLLAFLLILTAIVAKNRAAPG